MTDLWSSASLPQPQRPLVEVGPSGELIIYVREPAIDGQRCGHPAARSSPSLAKEPSQIRVRSDVVVCFA